MQNPPGLILASQSPRRRAMLTWLGVPFTVTNGEVDEAPLPGESPATVAARLALEKAQGVLMYKGVPTHAAKVLDRGWVLTADTVVDLGGTTLGKPADAAEARLMLEQLREEPHQVHTGIALGQVGGAIAVRLATTDIRMRPYTDAEITAYIATGDPADKAGAYAIQHPGFHPVADVSVCYANVVGLPLCAVVKLMAGEMEKGDKGKGAPDAGAGWDIDIDVPALCLRHFGYACPARDEGKGIDK